ncbi:Conjugal transfer protein TraG [Marine Group I thaumarchaeote SCGC AAA799-E16]|uniref:Conjugal transfer protein TraG n=2 Tax=Marine Group I TaxID=905826 RepID=A0A087S7Q0_9ARCH|nr:Conjugal transfer protein TraG [Marine Group I thaumarchaeote SCGC AAA799-E16]KFM21754.1 Conjugal transfer protein TraG [Marine Group I thaumarchaeote SCGC AAA799-B03]
MIFSELISDLQDALKKDLAQIRFLLKKNPAMGYTRIVDIGKEVGRKYNIKLVVNFPKEGRIEEFEMYGKRDLSLIIDYERKRFPIDREQIKQKALEFLGDVQTEDAYMYENKEGVRVFGENWKIDILPHSVHIWTEFDDKVTAFCDWLMENAYQMKKK